MAEEGDERNIYGFASESDFDRASRAIRYAEAEMRGSQEHRRPGSSSSPNTLTVQVQEDANADGYYRGQFTYYDVAQQSWVLHGDCFIFGINGEELKFSPATRYHGREIGHVRMLSDLGSFLPLVEVIVGVIPEEPPLDSGSGGGVIIPVPINIRCDPDTEEITYEIASYRITIVDGRLVMEVIE